MHMLQNIGSTTARGSLRGILFVIMIGLLVAPAAQAALILTISNAGGGNTLWTFSGNDIAGNGGLDFDDDTNINNTDAGGSHWDLADFSIGLNDTQVAPISTSALLTIGAETRGIDDAYIDTDGGLDDIGVGVTGTTNFAFSAGDLVSWTGSMIVGIDISNLIPGSYSSSTYGGVPGTLDLEVTVVPEPTTAMLMMMGLAGLAARKR